MTFFSSARLASSRLMGRVGTWCHGRCFYPHMLNIRRERLSYHSRILNQVYSNNSPRLLLKVLQDPSKMRYRPLRCVHRCALLHVDSFVVYIAWLKNPTANDEACDSLRSNTRRFSAFRSFISPVLSFTRHLEDSETKDSLAQDSTRVWCWDGGSFSDVSLPFFAYFSTFHNVQGWRLQIRVPPLKIEITNLCHTACHTECTNF